MKNCLSRRIIKGGKRSPIEDKRSLCQEGRALPIAETSLFTMGFAGKSAEEFFHLLRQAGVRRVIDVRLNNVSQLAGFTKKRDLEFFLREIAAIEYMHRPDLAPSKEILDDYKKKRIDWPEYEERFQDLLRERRPEDSGTPAQFDHACLLCSEAEPAKCHRRLLAEHLSRCWDDVTIRHL
ncbi:MAG TPA: DUF488 domain-containing protein [Phycisphaerae bacterium]|nr:DUF488 domain-containing protein [Phycisphaerae bacterium]HDZ43329.1 DUF488 domain-containing protein [Phycisphaerae bacterium]